MNDSLRIDELIAALPHWQQQICIKARNLIHQAVPAINEEMKFTDRPYFTYKGNVCALLPAKDHVTLFIYDPIALDPDGIINQGHNNKTARSIQVAKGTFPNEESFMRLVRAVADNNERGGWRKIDGRR